MNIFILGLGKSGRTTVAKALVNEEIYYVSAMDCFSATFRSINKGEALDDFQIAYKEYYSNILKLNHNFIIDNISDVMETNKHKHHFVIDGIVSPKDFTYLFDYNKDVVVFLNRIDNMTNGLDYEGLALNIIRDYCLWLSTMGLLAKERWQEYNYRIPGEESDFIKTLRAKNTVSITKSINKAITDLKVKLWHLNQQVIT